jgi:hypothetical protein
MAPIHGVHPPWALARRDVELGARTVGIHDAIVTLRADD